MTDGALTEKEQQALQKIADLFQAAIDVVGNRGAGKGRNIDIDLPFGKGAGMRSDIDVRIDGQRKIDSRGALSDTLYNSVPGISVGPKLPGGSRLAFIKIKPGRVS